LKKDKITKAEAKELQTKQGFTIEALQNMFDISTNRKQTFTVENERQYAIKVLNPISNLSQRERERVLLRAIKVNKA
tara:strand:- start:221 stop:451 length:231 start_codon:yes stop_codon:yes gene_type:complete